MNSTFSKNLISLMVVATFMLTSCSMQVSVEDAVESNKDFVEKETEIVTGTFGFPDDTKVNCLINVDSSFIQLHCDWVNVAPSLNKIGADPLSLEATAEVITTVEYLNGRTVRCISWIKTARAGMTCEP